MKKFKNLEVGSKVKAIKDITQKQLFGQMAGEEFEVITAGNKYEIITIGTDMTYGGNEIVVRDNDGEYRSFSNAFEDELISDVFAIKGA